MRRPVSSNASSDRPAPALAFIVLCALGMYLLMNSQMLGYIESDLLHRAVHKTLAYAAWLLAGFAVFFLLVCTADYFTLAVCGAATAISLTVNFSYAFISRKASATVPRWFVETMANEIDMLPRTLVEFRNEIIAGTVTAVAVLAIFLRLRALVRRRKSFSLSWLARPWVRRLAIAAFLGFHVLATVLQPTYTMAESNVFVSGLPTLFATAPDARAVPVRPVRTAFADKIVLLVDESVGYDVYRDVASSAIAKMSAIDFGIASSIANCSATSNALLRWGIEGTGLTTAGYDPQSNPKIWGFAKAAGFRTTLIDGQQAASARQNFVSKKEMALIDEYITAESGYATDRRIAAMLKERLRRPGREFIYVVKRGSHFPYEQNYPPGTVPNDAPPGVKYAAAVAYSTGDVLSSLAREVDFSNALVIYTSDHAQDLERRPPHCNPDPKPIEYSVPLVALTQVPALAQFLAPAATAMRNKASHINIFSTLLFSLGYDRSWIEETYGPTLAGPARPYPRLVVGESWPNREGMSLANIMWISPDDPRQRAQTAGTGPPE